MKKIISAIIAAAIVVSLTGCGRATQWVFKSGKSTVTAGIYLGLLVDSYAEAVEQIGTQDYSYESVKKQKIGDVNAVEWIKSRANDSAKTFIAVEEKFEELGLSFTQDEDTTIQAYIDNSWLSVSYKYETNGCNKKSYQKILFNNEKKVAIFKHYYDKGGIEEVPGDELLKFFTENFAKMKYIAVNLKSTSAGEDLDAETLIKLEERIQRYYNRAKDGEDFDKLIEEYTAELEAEKNQTDESTDSSDSSENSEQTSATSEASSDASESSEDISGAESEEDSSDISQLTEEEVLGKNFELLSKTSNQYSEFIMTKVFEMAEGSVELVEEKESGYKLILMRGHLLQHEKIFEFYRDYLLSEFKQSDFSKILDSAVDALTFDSNSTSLLRFSPGKLEF